jgi:hypothetical protein
MIYYQFDKIILSMTTKMSREDPDPAGSVIIWHPGSGSVTQGLRIQGSGYESERKLTDRQH